MTRPDQIRAAVLQVLTFSPPLPFYDLWAAVTRAFPDASATEVDQVAREWERGEVGRYWYSLGVVDCAVIEAKQMSLFGAT